VRFIDSLKPSMSTLNISSSFLNALIFSFNRFTRSVIHSFPGGFELLFILKQGVEFFVEKLFFFQKGFSFGD